MSNTDPVVTIAIPTYNRADTYLSQSLNSALEQTYENIEVVVSDNCSTDATPSLVRAHSDPRLSYFRQSENIGPVNNFNFCLQRATGDYFLLLHDDDLLDRDLVATCMHAARNCNDLALIRTGTRTINAEGEVLGEFANGVQGLSCDGFFRGWFADMTVWYLTSTLFSTRMLAAAGGFDTSYTTWPEARAIITLATQGTRLDIQEIKASFREHDGEITSATQTATWCEDSLAVLDMLCEAAQDAAIVRSEGLRHFSKVNYGIASRVPTPVARLRAYYVVLRTFGYPPPICYRFFYRNPAVRKLCEKFGIATQRIT